MLVGQSVPDIREYGVRAKLAMDEFDLDTIDGGLKKIEKAAADFKLYSYGVSYAASYCGADFLDVNGATLAKKLEEKADEIAEMQSKVKQITEEIRTSALIIFNSKQDAYNEVARAEEAAIRKQKNEEHRISLIY